MNTGSTVLVLLLLVPPSLAASRPRYGGVLKVSVVAPAFEMDPLLADTPADASVRALTARPLCRLSQEGVAIPTLAAEMTSSSPRRWILSLRPGLGSAQGAPLSAQDVAQTLQRVQTSVYRGLLASVRRISVRSPGAVELDLEYPFPDLSRSLCSPVTALLKGKGPEGHGPFVGGGEADLTYPEGRPYVDRAVTALTDERGADRALTLRQAHVVLGTTSNTPSLEGAALYGTYLLYNSARTGADIKDAVESALDRKDLTRAFVRSPAYPMHQLLPPALMGTGLAGETPKPTFRPKGNGRELTLLFDSQNVDQRAVAERLQVKMHDRGYRLILKGLPRAQLRSRWASRDFDLLLHALLLPPVPSAALALVFDAAGKTDLLTSELPKIGAVADLRARDALAKERAAALGATVPLIPLFAQGLAIQTSPQVVGLTSDPQGLPSLADSFLQPEGP